MMHHLITHYRKEAIYKSTGFAEYGTMKDSIEARGLIAMDPYLNIPKTTKFPSTLVLHGAKDDRIYLHEPLKYVMKMQQNNTGNNPILLDIDPNGTHNTVTSYYSYYGRVFSFALNETNQKVKF
jgi:prolyl oligopeptidase